LQTHTWHCIKQARHVNASREIAQVRVKSIDLLEKPRGDKRLTSQVPDCLLTSALDKAKTKASIISADVAEDAEFLPRSLSCDAT
jgi:hypothetical protein